MPCLLRRERRYTPPHPNPTIKTTLAPANLHTTIGSTSMGCVRLAALGLPRCVAVLFSRTNVDNYLHTFVLERKNATRPRGPPREAKRLCFVSYKKQKQPFNSNR